MRIKLLKTEHDYYEALERIEIIFDAKPNTKMGEELELLSFLAETYEEEHFPIENPHPIEAIKFRMEQMGLKPKDLVPCFGDKSRVSDVLNLKRKLNLTHIRKLHDQFDIPLNILAAEYAISEENRKEHA